MYFFMYRTHIRRGQLTFFTFCTCEGDAECVEALGKRSDDKVNSRKMRARRRELTARKRSLVH
jgi:hypothetical protein